MVAICGDGRVVGGEEFADGGEELGGVRFAGEFGLGKEFEVAGAEAGEGDGAERAAGVDGEEELCFRHRQVR